VLFESVAAELGGGAAGVLLTGMGRDGAEGLLAMRRAGAHTYAQDQGSCVVYGMPKEAVALSAAVEVLPPDQIAASLTEKVGWRAQS
jgi:two-component system chemotaxis response regulator CheB